MTAQLTGKDIRRVARRTVEALEGGGYRCCLFGSAACFIWGLDRTPNDIDIVVLNGRDAEGIKRYLVNENDRFFLVDAANPNETYKKLYFSLSWRLDIKCKVDILLPGQEPLHLPRVPIRHIAYPGESGIPVMPFLPLLILKVQGWYEHKSDSRRRMRAKVPQDVEDIEELMDLVDENDRLRNFPWLPRWFIVQAYTVVREYRRNRPASTDTWRYLEFSI